MRKCSNDEKSILGFSSPLTPPEWDTNLSQAPQYLLRIRTSIFSVSPQDTYQYLLSISSGYVPVSPQYLLRIRTSISSVSPQDTYQYLLRIRILLVRILNLPTSKGWKPVWPEISAGCEGYFACKEFSCMVTVKNRNIYRLYSVNICWVCTLIYKQ